MTDRPYENFSLADLYQEQEDAKTAIDLCRATQADIEAELQARYGPSVLRILAGAAGTSSSAEGPYRVKGVAAKDITWDSDALLAMAFGMNKEAALRTFNIKVTMPEKTYAAVTGQIRADAEKARTEDVKPIKFTLEKKK